MKMHINKLEPERFYHIYNRGVNGEDIFKEERNYLYFLKKYTQHVSPYVATYAYCLLKNHFHLLIRTRSEDEIIAKAHQTLHPNKDSENRKNASWLLSNAFSSLFKSYAQAINKAYKRTGALFEEPFRRVPVLNDAYFAEIVYYIHRNPQKHGFVKDFRDYPHSSYHSHLLNTFTRLQREEVIACFGGKQSYEKFHLGNEILKNLDKFDIEFD